MSAAIHPPTGAGGVNAGTIPAKDGPRPATLRCEPAPAPPAPCYGDPRYTAPDLTPAEARRLADRCTGCPLLDVCERIVRPRTSGFDGICGGRWWRDGLLRPMVGGVGSPEWRAALSDEQCRAYHSAHACGRRTVEVVNGNREYERRKRRPAGKREAVA